VTIEEEGFGRPVAVKSARRWKDEKVGLCGEQRAEQINGDVEKKRRGGKEKRESERETTTTTLRDGGRARGRGDGRVFLHPTQPALYSPTAQQPDTTTIHPSSIQYNIIISIISTIFFKHRPHNRTITLPQIYLLLHPCRPITLNTWPGQGK
jgi:hypothetical protein